MGDISLHLSKDEIRCKCGKCNWDNLHWGILQKVEEIRLYANKYLTVCINDHSYSSFLDQCPICGSKEKFPQEWECGIFPTSGCRCPDWNVHEDGSLLSWHLPRRWNYQIGTTLKPGWELVSIAGVAPEILEKQYYSLAIDFYIKRRVINRDYVSQWAFDSYALKAVWDFYKYTHFGGLKLYKETCFSCKGIGKRTTTYEDKTCPVCQGTGYLLRLHLDVRPSIWRESDLNDI